MSSILNGSANSTPQSNLSSLLMEKMEIMQEMERRQRTNRRRFYKPYPKQIEFHTAGASHRERHFVAGNQLGKTLVGAVKADPHLASAAQIAL